MIPLSVLVFAAFYRMFTGIVRRYAERIHSLEGPKEPVYKTFSLKGSISDWDWGCYPPVSVS